MDPFAASTFEGGGPGGGYLLPTGDSLRFRHRIRIHKGDTTEGKVACLPRRDRRTHRDIASRVR